MKQSKKRKQTLKSAQYGQEIIFNMFCIFLATIVNLYLSQSFTMKSALEHFMESHSIDMFNIIITIISSNTTNVVCVLTRCRISS